MRLTFQHNFAETYSIEYLRMIPSENTSTKACKLNIIYINWSSQQARCLRGWNKMFLDEKKLRFILSDYSFEGRESNPIWITQKNLLTVQCDIDIGCIRLWVCLWHAKKDLRMTLASLDRESLDCVSWTTILVIIFWNFTMF